MRKPKPVDGWQKCWKWFSVQSMALAAAIQGAWMVLPDDMKTSVPQSWVSYVTIGLLILGVIGRLVKQDE